VRRPLLLLILLALATGCSGDDGDQSGPTTTSRTATSSSAPPTSAAAPVPADCPDQPDIRAGSPPPAQGSALTDGMFFGYITALDAEDLKLTFDAAQLLTGEAAAKAAAAEGGEASDFWSRNDSRATRALTLAETAVLCISTPDDAVHNRKVALPQLNQALGDGEPMAVWIDVRARAVVRVQQQYFP
jgi:hypothetical protein